MEFLVRLHFRMYMSVCILLYVYNIIYSQMKAERIFLVFLHFTYGWPENLGKNGTLKQCSQNDWLNPKKNRCLTPTRSCSPLIPPPPTVLQKISFQELLKCPLRNTDSEVWHHVLEDTRYHDKTTQGPVQVETAFPETPLLLKERYGCENKS